MTDKTVDRVFERVIINSIKEGCEKCDFFKRRIDSLRVKRNKLLFDTDYYFLPDIIIDENKLNTIKSYRLELRDFVNKLMNEDIKDLEDQTKACNIFDKEFDKKYFPQLKFE